MPPAPCALKLPAPFGTALTRAVFTSLTANALRAPDEIREASA